MNVKRQIAHRLEYVVSTQNWETMGIHYWIKQALDVSYPSLPLSSSLFHYISISASLPLCLTISTAYLSICLSLSHYIPLSSSLSHYISLSASLPLYLTISSAYLSICLSLHPCLTISLYLAIFLFVSLYLLLISTTPTPPHPHPISNTHLHTCR